jgi:DNA-binding beta-propeller fold protein YncE
MPLGPAVLLRYDREGLQLLEQHEFASGISDIVLGGGFLWVGLEQERRLMRIAPGSEPEHGAWLTAPSTELAYGAGHVWASVESDDSVARIDPRTKLAVTNIAGRRPQQLVVAHGRVFVASNTNHRIVFLNRKTGERLGSPLRVPPNPTGMAVGAGHVWVTGIGANTLTRLDYGS